MVVLWYRFMHAVLATLHLDDYIHDVMTLTLTLM